MTIGEKIFVFIIFLFGVFIYYVATQIPKPAFGYGIGPDLWPKIMLAGIIFLTAILLIKGWKKRPKESKPASEEGVEKPSRTRMVAVLVLSFIYTYAMYQWGFLVVTPFFIAVMLYLLRYRKVWAFFVYSIGFTGVFYLIFVMAASIILPRGHGIFRTFSLIFY
jgi:putative tricarboxylic transport membrane protein